MSTPSEISQNGKVKHMVLHDASTAKKINNLLNSSKTRLTGLELLKSHLPHCSDDDFVEFCVNWMQNCCKVDGRQNGSLFKVSSKYPELKKSVSFFITTRYFDYFFKYFINSQTGWSCTESCFLLYRGACGPFHETIEKHLTEQIEGCGKVSSNIAKCFALFPCLGGGGNEGINYRNNWQAQFVRFLSKSHLLLNALFVDVEEFQEYDGIEPVESKPGGTNQNAEALSVQLYNHSRVLNFMLLNQYPAGKCVPTDLAFQLICRGLAINPKLLKRHKTTETISLQKVLPQIHDVLLSLLKALIVTCRTQLLPYSHLICKLIKQTLEWTESQFGHEGVKPFACLRISAYETLGNWLAVTRNGSCGDTVSGVILSNAVSDISSKEEVVLLKESKQKGKYKRIEHIKRRTGFSDDSRLCLAALKALQCLLQFAGVLLKAEEHKFLQEVVVKLITDVQNKSPTAMVAPFSASVCRRELYSLLLELVYNPCPAWAPPTHFALRLLHRGRNDCCPLVSQFCTAAVNNLTVIMHPHFDNGGFSTGDASRKGNRGEVTLELNELMEVENVAEEAEAISERGNEAFNDCDADARGGPPETEAEKNSEDSVVLSDEDSTNTVPYLKTDDANDEDDEKAEASASPTSKDNEPIAKGTAFEDFDGGRNKTPSPAKETDPPSAAASHSESSKTPKGTEDAALGKSTSPDSGNEDGIPRKRYFLRSNTSHGLTRSSEEPEEAKRTSSPESARNTPTRGLLRGTPGLQSASKRPRTRAHVKAGDSESEAGTPKRTPTDDDENIIASFADSFADEN